MPKTTLSARQGQSFSRRRWITLGAWTAGATAVAGVAGTGVWMYQPVNDRQLVFATLQQAMQEVERLSAAGAQALEPATAWSWSQTLEHCAQSIEFSLRGFPAPKAALFQHTAGAAAFAAFAALGRMRHSLAEPIPGAPALAAAAPGASAALARLRQAVQDFAARTGPLQPHFAYGSLGRTQYEQAHAMHLANHLSAFDVRLG